MPDFASTLVRAREKRGLTQAQVAVKAGLTPSYLSFIENRKKPPPSDEVCRRLARVLGIPARRLIEISHLERAPETVRREVRTLRTSLTRERRSRRRVLEALLSPFLFAGPPGFLESALETLGLSPVRKRKLEDALAAVGRHRHNQANEVARIVDELPERDRNRLLAAIPRALEENAGAAASDIDGDAKRRGRLAPRSATASATAPGDGAGADADADAGTSAGTGAGTGTAASQRAFVPGAQTRDPSLPPPLLYSLPRAASDRPEVAFLVELDAAWEERFDDLHAGDLLLIDPALQPEPGDLVALMDPGGGQLRRLVQAASGQAANQGPEARTGPQAGRADPATASFFLAVDDAVAPGGPSPAGQAHHQTSAGSSQAPRGRPAALSGPELRQLLAERLAGTVVEVRRPLRRRR